MSKRQTIVFRAPGDKPAESEPARLTLKWGKRQTEIAGALLLILFAPISLLGVLGWAHGVWVDGWANGLRWLFGWGALLVPLVIAFIGYGLIRGRVFKDGQAPWNKIVGMEIVFFCGLGLFHILAIWADPWQLFEQGGGGGLFGWGLAVLLMGWLGGRLLSSAVLMGGVAAGLALVFHGQVANALKDWLDLWDVLGTAYTQPKSRGGAARQPPSGVPTAENGSRAAQRMVETPPLSATPLSASQSEETARPRKAAEPALKNLSAPEKKSAKPIKRDRNLPSLDLLEPSPPQDIGEDEIKQRAELIKDTLRQFGLETNIVGYSIGPAVTQYAVEPGFIERAASDGSVRRQKVRVGQIVSLANDLALALAAPMLRIEAPVPGESYVGIEVPNLRTARVGLRDLMESQPFRKITSAPLAVALGKDVGGHSIVADLGAMPHLLIAGTTGSGKSVCINALITCLVINNQPEDLKLVMIDPKMVELVRWNGLPHLYGKVETDLERIVGVLRWVTREMDARYKRFAQVGARNLADYNKKVVEENKAPGAEEESKLPRMVVFIDELADLMMMAPVEVEKTICRIAQMARATGIHMTMATQRPSTDVVTGLIKANFPARISFAVASSVDSRVILDGMGAEALLGKGDMLYQSPDAGHPVRLQGCYVSDGEVEKVVKYWQDKMAAEEFLPEEAPWEQALLHVGTSAEEGGVDAVSSEEDEALLQKAIVLVRQQRGASASLLQRKLRVGYPKAARLIDQLEEMGIIGPPEAAGRLREVLVPPGETPE